MYFVRCTVAGLLTWINCTNVKWATKVQDVFTSAKILALVIIIAAGVYHLATGNVEHYQRPFHNTTWDLAAFATAFYQGLFSFAGWYVSFQWFCMCHLSGPLSF